MVLIRHRSSLPALMGALAAALALSGAVGAPRAAAAAPYAWCTLSQRDHEPPGGTSAYDLKLYVKRVSCRLGVAVMKSFHRCRTESGHRCARTVLGRWRCTGWKRTYGTPRIHGSFMCAWGARRVKSRYQQDTPACFGAAARDPKRRCFSRARDVEPKLGVTDPEPFWACDSTSVPGACVYGAADKDARRHAAIVGDSHIHHWATAFSVAVNALRWRGYSMLTGGCFFSTAAASFSPGCKTFYDSVQDWLEDHPEVDTLFVSQNADTPVEVPGKTYREAKIDGFKEAWAALPKTVKHVVVLRDTTRSSQSVLNCIHGAIADGTRRLAPLCPNPRSVALREDMAVAAARELRSDRYDVVDLSDFMCSATSCYPVVGGTLVNADIWGHLNLTFARTLGPYLLREMRRVSADW